jgi:major membrane immunogen (membrane-anchored lipoprotein)
MNKRFSFLSLLMGLFVCMLVLTSCSKSDDDGGSSSNPLVGTWYTEGEEKGYPTYEEITYNANNTCTWRDYKSDKTTIKETDSGTYKVDGNKLSIWWSGSSTPWTTTFSISGNKMTTSEGGGTVWTKK